MDNEKNIDQMSIPELTELVADLKKEAWKPDGSIDAKSIVAYGKANAQLSKLKDAVVREKYIEERAKLAEKQQREREWLMREHADMYAKWA